MKGKAREGRADRAHEIQEFVLRGNREGAEKEVDAAAPGLEMRRLQVEGLKVLALGLEHVAPARDRVHGGRGIEPGRRVAALSSGIIVEVLQKARVRGHGGKDADGEHEG